MKYRFFFILVLLICTNSFSQNYYEGVVEYVNKTTFKSKEDSVNYQRRLEKYGDAFIILMSSPKSEKYLVKKDTVLNYKYYKKNSAEQIILIATKDKFGRLDVISGSVDNKWKDYTPKNYLNFNKYERLESEDQIILQRKCKAYVSNSKYGRKKIWLGDVKGIPPTIKNTNIFLNNKIILKEITYNKNDGRIIEKIASNIRSLENDSFKKILEIHLKIDIKSKYQPIKENEKIEEKPIKLNEQLVNLYYREVFENKLSNLYETTKTSDFTIIEMWGTWCLPCLIANEKIKNLRGKFNKEKLNIISINAHDRNIDKVKSLIKKKEMNWKHGYTTKKITSILNKKGRYPRLIIVNRENTILFIGNPNTDIIEIKKIIE